VAKTATDRISLRGGVYYYVRRVPQAFVAFDERVIVRISLKTGERQEAIKGAIVAERELEALWSSLAAQGGQDAWRRYHAALERARLEGFVYRSAAEVAQGKLSDILDRLESLEDRPRDRSARTALLGGEAKPDLTLTAARELWFGYSAGKLLGKRPDQVRRWENPRKLAVKEFVDCIGEDKPIAAVSRDDARKFQDLWLARVRDDGYGRNQMNKQIGHLSTMFSTVSEELKLGLDPVFAKLAVSELKRARPPFDRAWVEKKILAPGALAGLNLDARVALLVCAETGMGAEEVTSLRAETIHLKAKVPYVSIVSREGAMQKNAEYRPRDIPLVGIALEAMKLRPAGIERYYDKNVTLSSAVNKYLRENKLLQSDKHTLYSFRHSFQDRLTAAEAPDRIQADLMGHKYTREKYGKGPDLTQKRRWLERIAYKPAGGVKA